MAKDTRETKQGTVALTRLQGDVCGQTPQMNANGKIWYPNFGTSAQIVTFNYCAQTWARLEWLERDGTVTPMCAMRVCDVDALNAHDFVLFDSYVHDERWTGNCGQGHDGMGARNDYRTPQFRMIVGFMNWCGGIHVPPDADSRNWKNHVKASKPAFLAMCGDEKPFAIV